jgi:hypothetical protein
MKILLLSYNMLFKIKVQHNADNPDGMIPYDKGQIASSVSV